MRGRKGVGGLRLWLRLSVEGKRLLRLRRLDAPNKGLWRRCVTAFEHTRRSVRCVGNLRKSGEVGFEGWRVSGIVREPG